MFHFPPSTVIKVNLVKGNFAPYKMFMDKSFVVLCNGSFITFKNFLKLQFFKGIEFRVKDICFHKIFY